MESALKSIVYFIMVYKSCAVYPSATFIIFFLNLKELIAKHWPRRHCFRGFSGVLQIVGGQKRGSGSFVCWSVSLKLTGTGGGSDSAPGKTGLSSRGLDFGRQFLPSGNVNPVQAADSEVGPGPTVLQEGPWGGETYVSPGWKLADPSHISPIQEHL